MAATKNTAEPVCLFQTNGVRWRQEVYETASGHAEIRARQLRNSGYTVMVFAMGSQVTSVGTVKLTMVDIRPGINLDTQYLPDVRIERI